MNKLNKIEPFKELLLRAEPRLSAAESNDMWSGIEKRLAAKSRFTKSAVWRAAAVVSLLLASAWVAYVAWSGSSDERFFTRQLPDSYAQASIRFEDRLIEVEHDAVISWNLAERKLEINQGNTKISLQSESEDGCMMAFVPTGNKIILKLADGSQVTLREGSKLMFPLRFGDVRHVDLQGEAYVKVTKDMHRPFTVKSDLLAVTVLGTEFLFSAYPESEEQKVALVEGLVEVTPHEGKAVRLHPNETYTYRRTKETFVVGKNEAIDELVSWKDCILLLKDKPLVEVLKQLETIYNTRLYYNESELQGISLNGKLDVDVPLRELLYFMTQIAPISYERGNKGEYSILSTLPSNTPLPMKK